ncbi:MAG: transcriptional regulator GcvA [Rhodobacteraceae bacterium]|nr:transcriptional regulator GcvA [Paracoccaceae bacterium]
MSDRLPPLTSLRAFEAAARHMSFARAADELSVTPAALSFQIKSLEQHLGQPVFRRLNRAVELTESGKLLAPGVQEGFEQLTAAWRAARRLQDHNKLTVTAGPAVTSVWLAPRLYAFAQAHPEIDLNLSAALRTVDLIRDDVDVALRFGHGDDAGLFSRDLSPEWFSPMMTPALAEKFPTPESLVGEHLLVDNSTAFLRPHRDWQSWFEACGITHTPTDTIKFSQADHAISAAVAGAGVLLGRVSLSMRSLAKGQLIAPFPIALGTTAKLRFMCPKGHETRPATAALLSWISEEFEKHAHVLEGKELHFQTG